MDSIGARLAEFMSARLQRQGRLVPARIQAALALLERAREHPSVFIEDHMSPGSAGLKGHETYGDRALQRFQVSRINKNHGRRSSDVRDWGPELLALISEPSGVIHPAALEEAQSVLAQELRALANLSPITVSLRGRSAASVVDDILVEADDRGLAGEVAQYLVSAKLALRLPDTQVPRKRANAPDKGELGDLLIGSTVVEIAMGTPDEAHLRKAAEAVEQTDLDVWLIVRSHRVDSWRQEVIAELDQGARRVTVFGVNEFVGQNLGELGALVRSNTLKQLREVVQLYNKDWATPFGPPGLIIELTA